MECCKKATINAVRKCESVDECIFNNIYIFIYKNYIIVYALSKSY